MTHADDMLARAFPETADVKWGIDGLTAWLTVTWLKNPLVQHTEHYRWEEPEFPKDDTLATLLCDAMSEYRSQRLVSRLLVLVKQMGERP